MLLVLNSKWHRNLLKKWCHVHVRFRSVWTQPYFIEHRSKEKKLAEKENADGSVPMKKVGGWEDDTYVAHADGKKAYQASFSLALARTFGGTFLMAAFLKLVHDCLMFVSPQILKWVFIVDKNI